MNSSALRAIVLGAIVVAIVGCKSGPQFAWWKRDKAPDDTSAVARSAAPELPSAQSKPQTVAVDGLTPAAPPSSANLAAAGATSTQIAAGTAATSPATIASAPIAQYPATNETVKQQPPVSAAATAAQVAAATPKMLSAGPYDPNAYGSSTVGTSSPASSGTAAAVADRYAIAATQRYAPPAASASAPSTATSPSSAPPAATGDRYAFDAGAPVSVSPSNDRYGQAMTQSPSAASVAPSAAPPAPAVVAPTPTATVQVATTTPGQFRPGGTASYTASQASPAIEVASRPSTPTTTPAPAQDNAPAAISEPWAPPSSAPPAAGSGNLTR